MLLAFFLLAGCDSVTNVLTGCDALVAAHKTVDLVPSKSTSHIDTDLIIDKVVNHDSMLELSNNHRTAKYRKSSITKIVSFFNTDTGFEEISINVIGQDGASEWLTNNMDIRLKVLNSIDSK